MIETEGRGILDEMHTLVSSYAALSLTSVPLTETKPRLEAQATFTRGPAVYVFGATTLITNVVVTVLTG